MSTLYRFQKSHKNGAISFMPTAPFIIYLSLFMFGISTFR